MLFFTRQIFTIYISITCRPHALVVSQLSLYQLYKIHHKYKEKMKHQDSITGFARNVFCFWCLWEKECTCWEISKGIFIPEVWIQELSLIHHVMWLRHLQCICLSYGNYFCGPRTSKLNGNTEKFCVRLLWSSLWVSVPEDLMMNWKVKKKKTLTRNLQYLNPDEHIFVPQQVPRRTLDFILTWCRTSKTSSDTVVFFYWRRPLSSEPSERFFWKISSQFSVKREEEKKQFFQKLCFWYDASSNISTFLKNLTQMLNSPESQDLQKAGRIFNNKYVEVMRSHFSISSKVILVTCVNVHLWFKHARPCIKT